MDCSPCPKAEWDVVVIIFKFALIDLGEYFLAKTKKTITFIGQIKLTDINKGGNALSTKLTSITLPPRPLK